MAPGELHSDLIQTDWPCRRLPFHDSQGPAAGLPKGLHGRPAAGVIELRGQLLLQRHAPLRHFVFEGLVHQPGFGLLQGAAVDEETRVRRVRGALWPGSVPNERGVVATLGVCTGFPPVAVLATPANLSTSSPPTPIHRCATGVSPFACTVTAIKYQLPGTSAKALEYSSSRRRFPTTPIRVRPIVGIVAQPHGRIATGAVTGSPQGNHALSGAS